MTGIVIRNPMVSARTLDLNGTATLMLEFKEGEFATTVTCFFPDGRAAKAIATAVNEAVARTDGEAGS